MKVGQLGLKLDWRWVSRQAEPSGSEVYEVLSVLLIRWEESIGWVADNPLLVVEELRWGVEAREGLEVRL